MKSAWTDAIGTFCGQSRENCMIGKRKHCDLFVLGLHHYFFLFRFIAINWIYQLFKETLHVYINLYKLHVTTKNAMMDSKFIWILPLDTPVLGYVAKMVLSSSVSFCACFCGLWHLWDRSLRKVHFHRNNCVGKLVVCHFPEVSLWVQ